MKNMFGDPPSEGPQREFRIEDMDFSKLAQSKKWILLAGFLILAWTGFNWARTFYVDWLWYSQLGYESVIWTEVTTQLWLFLLGLPLFLILAAPNLFLAFRFAGRPKRSLEGLSQEQYEIALKVLAWMGGGLALVAGLIFAANLAGQWQPILQFFHAVPFHETDPVFERDFSFYVFTLPVLQYARGWLFVGIIVILLLVGGTYYLSALLRGEPFAFEGRLRSHTLLLGAAIFVLIAAEHWLQRYELLYSTTGTVYGVGYTDDWVTLPARTLLTAVALLSAGCLTAAAFTSGKRLILWAVGGWIGLSFLASSVVPGMVQRFQVEPSELAREREYLVNNISLTRRAYGLEKLATKDHPARDVISPEAITENEGTVQNIRLWDEGPLLQSYNQIQFFRLYYDFLQVHTDRYRIDDELRQVMLATRELSPEKLPSEAQRWVNRHLQFTHGYGVAMSPVTEVEAGGRPSFMISDVPPRGEIALERPDIYYGLKSLDFVIANSEMEEFNYPGPEGPVYTRYQGEGGVLMSSLFRRLIYAMHFGDLNILISGEINPDSRIQYRRTVPERFSTVTPFLMRDQEAYTVIADGRILWIQDAYTVTSRYPYSTPYRGSFNYLRNSVKAVVDAYDGSIDYYVADPQDPLIQTYEAVFPGLFKPMEELPEYLADHIRYPQDLFSVQTQMLLQYHMVDPVVFYNKEDQWSIPLQNSFGNSEHLNPYYIVARLPGEEKEEFLLIQPFTPANRHNLVGWMAARSDGDRYGELLLFNFPTGQHIDGPNQIEARIDNDAVISEQFTLWGQVGSEVLRGILLVIPVGDSLLYAEPVFLKPETLEFPELRRIILADSDKVVMQPTLEMAIEALVGKRPAVAPLVEEDQEGVLERPPATAVPSADLDEIRRAIEEAAEKLREALEQLEQAEP